MDRTIYSAWAWAQISPASFSSDLRDAAFPLALSSLQSVAPRSLRPRSQDSSLEVRSRENLYFELRSLDARRWPRLWLRERLRWRRCLSRDRERDDFRRSLEVDLDRLRRRSRERDLLRSLVLDPDLLLSRSSRSLSSRLLSRS